MDDDQATQFIKKQNRLQDTNRPKDVLAELYELKFIEKRKIQ